MKEVLLFKAIGDENRVKILLLLSKKNICAKGIAKHLSISEAAVSQHIKILKDVNLIIGYKHGYHVIYELNKKPLEDGILFLNHVIHEDFNLISTQFNINIQNSNLLDCKSSCKSTKNCCKNKIMED